MPFPLYLPDKLKFDDWNTRCGEWVSPWLPVALFAVFGVSG